MPLVAECPKGIVVPYLLSWLLLLIATGNACMPASAWGK